MDTNKALGNTPFVIRGLTRNCVGERLMRHFSSRASTSFVDLDSLRWLTRFIGVCVSKRARYNITVFTHILEKQLPAPITMQRYRAALDRSWRR